jgi:hypothetical protein
MAPSQDATSLLSTRPHTAQALPLPPPFSQTQHMKSPTSFQHYHSRPSFQDHHPTDSLTLTRTHTRAHSSVPTKSTAAARWKHDNRLKRTIETMTTGVEKFIGKMGLSRPMRQSIECSTSTRSNSNPSKKTSVHGTTESNSVGRPYRTKSKISKRKLSNSQSTASNATLVPTAKTSLNQDLDFTTKLQSVLNSNPSSFSTISLQSLAFPATAGAGAKAAVAKHKRSYLMLNEFALEQQEYAEDNMADNNCLQDLSDFEITTTQSYADSMDLDTLESETLPGEIQS